MAEYERGGDNIAALIAKSGDVKVNWDAFERIPENYRKAQDWKYQQNIRNAFKGPDGNFRSDLLDDKGLPDSSKLYQRLMLVGGAPVADAAAKMAETGFQQDRYRNAPTVQAVLDGNSGGAGTVFPPSASRSAPTQVAPAIGQGRTNPSGPPQPSQGGTTIAQVLTAQGFPNDQIGPASASIARQIGLSDPTQPFDKDDQRIRGVLVPAIAQLKRMGIGQIAQPGQPTIQTIPPVGQPQQVAQAQPQLPMQGQPVYRQPMQASSDPTLGGLIPPGYEPGPYLQRLQALAGSGRVLPDQLKVLEQKISAIQTALQPTTEQKNARAAGMSVRDYLDRSDTANTDRAVLTNSILPKLDKSQESATAARDEIQSIHRAREQLDAPGGIFSGAAADVRMKVAKVAEFLGVPNADKIANTEAFGSAIGQRTLSLVKSLGAGAGISNADRDFAAAMAGGNIKLDEKSIRRILDIGERAARARIDQHNGLTDRTLKSSEALKEYGGVYRIEQPGEYQRAQQATPRLSPGSIFNGFKYKGGDPNDQRSWGRI